MRTTIYIILFTILSLSVFAGEVTKVLEKEVKVFKNSNCELKDSCDLKKFQLKIFKIKAQYNKQPPRYNVMMEGFYETDTNENLENYAIVQFIKGKVVDFGRKSDFKNFAIRTYFNKTWSKMYYKDWQIDSIDEDPIYKSFFHPKEKKWYRHGAYEVNDEMKSLTFGDYERKYFIYEKPKKKPRLYFSDAPSGSHINSQVTRESLLEFKTCLYKTIDVPTTIDPKNINFATPISCLEWDGKFKYNKKKDDFELI